MSNKHVFSLEPRTISGKKVKQLRAQRLIPANIVVPHEGSVLVSAPYREFMSLYSQIGETGLVYLEVAGDKTKRPALIEEIQFNGLTSEVTHVSFRQVNLKEKIKAEVPVLLVGESSIPDTVVLLVKDSIEVEALPTDLPEKFEINAEKLTEIGQMITFADLDYDKSKVELMISEEEMTTPVAMLQEHKEEVEPAAEAAPAEGAEAPAGDKAAEAAAE